MALNKMVLFDRIYREGLYDEFIDFAVFMQMEKGYSFFNSALILLQRPGAMYIESEDVWESRYNRHILPDATPIVIMMPFGPIEFVYDFSDTYGDVVPRNMRDSFELPRADPSIGERLPRLIQIVNQLGIYYGEKDYGSRQGGQAEYIESAMNVKILEKKKEIILPTHYAITVNRHSKNDQKVTTILHEIGHVLCGHLPDDKANQRLKVPDRKKEELSEEQKEFEAERVCELICKAWGVYYENNDYLDGYLVNGKEPYFSVRVVVEAADKFMKLMFMA